MSVGNKIKRYRELLGMTQLELSQISGVSLSGIKKYESGERIPKPRLLEKIADAFQVYPSALYGYQAESFAPEVFPLFISVIKAVNAKISLGKDGNGETDTNSVIISFDCPEFNTYLRNFMESNEIVESLRKEAERTPDKIAKEFLLSRADEIEIENELEFAKKRRE